MTAYDDLLARTHAQAMHHAKTGNCDTMFISVEEWKAVRADRRIINHVDYGKQELSFKMNGITVKVSKDA